MTFFLLLEYTRTYVPEVPNDSRRAEDRPDSTGKSAGHRRLKIRDAMEQQGEATSLLALYISPVR